MLSLVRDLADAIGPSTAALEDDGRLVLVRDGELVQRADAAGDHDRRVRRAHGERVAHPAHPRGDRDVNVLVGVLLAEPGEHPDHEPIRAFRAAARGLHHSGEPTGDEDRARARDVRPDQLRGRERRGRWRIVRILRTLPDDGDEVRATYLTSIRIGLIRTSSWTSPVAFVASRHG